jgi:RNA polymerase sigma factor (sigma-70 family)
VRDATRIQCNDWHDKEGLSRISAPASRRPDSRRHEYENIRRKLTAFFRWNHCRDAESLADETIDRVIRRTQELKVSNVHAYINGVARNVFLEARRHNARRATFDDTVESTSWDASSAEEEERQLEFRVDCLKRCLQNLTPVERQLIMDYGLPQKGVKRRQELAESLGITLETLRVQVFRARRKLRALVAECLQRHGDS